MRTDVGRDQQKLCQSSVSPHRKTPLVAEPLAEILLRRGGTAGEAIFKARCRRSIDQVSLYRSVVQKAEPALLS
jgi:hypothetical protein